MYGSNIRIVVTSPFIQLVRGGILVGTALFESFETGIEKVIGSEIGILHGLIALGVLEILHGIADLIDGAQNVAEARAARGRPAP